MRTLTTSLTSTLIQNSYHDWKLSYWSKVTSWNTIPALFPIHVASATLAISWFPEHTNSFVPQQHAILLSGTLFHYIVTWLTPSFHLCLFKMLPLQNSHLTELARMSTSSSHYPSTCNHSLSSPEIIYTYTHMCKYTYLYANLLYELHSIFP